jgi:exopolysaccharide biosynthesis WecB/TagA/CpsF family protein
MNSLHNNSYAPHGRVQRAFRKLNRSYVLYINGILPLADCFCLLASAYLAARIEPAWLARASFEQQGYLAVLSALGGAFLLYDRRFGAIASRGKASSLLSYYLMGFAKFVGCIIVIGAVSKTLDTVPRSVLAAWLLLGLLTTSLVRTRLAATVRRLAHSGILSEVVAIVGAGALAERLGRHLRQTRPVSIDLLGVFDDAPRAPASGASLAGSIDDLIELGKTRHIDWIFLTLPLSDEQHVLSVVNRLKSLSVSIALCPRNVGLCTPYYMIDYVGDDVPVALLRARPQQGWSTALRSVGQFLPRWITTLVLMPALLLSLMKRSPSSKRRPADAGRLLCDLDHHDLDSFLEVARHFGQHRYGFVVTPNVDHLIRLHDDPAFRSLYAKASYVLLDSRFLAHLLRLTRRLQLPVCPGSDLTRQLFERVIAAEDGIVLIGGNDTQARQLANRYGLDNLAHFNPPRRFIEDPAAVEDCLQFIEAHSPFRFCLLAVGSPQQEVLAQRLQARGVARGLTLCVGASIDLMTDVERRAPRWMQACALEWLYRLLQNPARMAPRYLVRGPRVFRLLRRTVFVSRTRSDNPAVIKEAA